MDIVYSPPYQDNTEIPPELWHLIAHNIEDPDPKNVTVFLIWLMQVNKFFGRIISAFFEQRNIEPFKSTTDSERMYYPPPTRLFRTITTETRYGVEIKKAIRQERYSTATYRFVHKSCVVSMVFLAGSNNKLSTIRYFRPEYDYEIELDCADIDKNMNPIVARRNCSRDDIYQYDRSQEHAVKADYDIRLENRLENGLDNCNISYILSNHHSIDSESSTQTHLAEDTQMYRFLAEEFQEVLKIALAKLPCAVGDLF